MSTIFLDMDGVLNDHEWNSEAQSTTLKLSCVSQFNKIITECDPDIVLCSAWRYMVHGQAITLKGFQYLLRTHGITEKTRIVGMTKLDEEIPTRKAQIQDWIDRHAVLNYVVIDDLPDVSPDPTRHVRPHEKIGLRGFEVEKVISLLQKVI